MKSSSLLAMRARKLPSNLAAARCTHMSGRRQPRRRPDFVVNLWVLWKPLHETPFACGQSTLAHGGCRCQPLESAALGGQVTQVGESRVRAVGLVVQVAGE